MELYYAVYNLYNWHFSLNMIPLRFIQVVAFISNLLLYSFRVIFCVWMYHTPFNHSPHEQSFCEHSCTTSCVNLSFYVSWLNAQGSNCWTPVWFYKSKQKKPCQTIPFYVPTRNLGVIQFLCIFASMWYCHYNLFNHSVDVWRYVIMVQFVIP